MAYGLHITRRPHWSDDAGGEDDITISEWTRLIDADDRLEPKPVIEITTPIPTQPLRKDGVGIAIWTGHPKGYTACFDLSFGKITLGNPDDAVLAKMIEVAAKLGAQVQGDEGERYPI